MSYVIVTFEVTTVTRIGLRWEDCFHSVENLFHKAEARAIAPSVLCSTAYYLVYPGYQFPVWAPAGETVLQHPLCRD